jgi:hypothetical protein
VNSGKRKSARVCPSFFRGCVNKVRLDSPTMGRASTPHIMLLGGSSGLNGKVCGPIHLNEVMSSLGTLDHKGLISPFTKSPKRSRKEQRWSCFKRCLSIQGSEGESTGACRARRAQSRGIQEKLRVPVGVLGGHFSAQGCVQTAHSCGLGGAVHTEDAETHAVRSNVLSMARLCCEFAVEWSQSCKK